MTKKAAKEGKAAGQGKPVVDSSATFEKLLKNTSSKARYSLRLFITGSTPRSTEAISTVRKLCEEYLAGRYDLEVVDIYQQPAQAGVAQIIAAPTLIKDFPNPPKRLVGDLSNREKVIVGLNLRGDNQGENVTWSTV
ncbi:MAG TPA: circadian clock KaiB family protein [Candidatus Acidoferrales bacterium]|nr:circadian clock KaiB family protein [Candidatus Acidoferrales bacterium]